MVLRGFRIAGCLPKNSGTLEVQAIPLITKTEMRDIHLIGDLVALVEVMQSEAGALRSYELRFLTVDVVGRHWQFP